MENSLKNKYDLIVAGGGAAGFYGAIRAAEMNRDLRILILEKTNKLLSKVRISGGGRCNLTHNCFDPIQLSHHYPRGQKQLKNIFKLHSATHTIEWFKSKGVSLKVEDDGRIFPESNISQTIIDCLINEAVKRKIKIEMGEGVVAIDKQEKKFLLRTQTHKTYMTETVLIATGGNPGRQAYEWIAALGHTIISPVPSLFTFNDSEKKFSDLMGVSVPVAEVKIAGTKFSEAGPVLITHWGLSGPAVIRLSAWAAEYLHQVNYTFTALVSWVSPAKEDDIRARLTEHKKDKPMQRVLINPLFGVPQRLWFRLCELSDIGENKIWGELPQKNINRLMESLIRSPFKIKGKTTFKEEFVTCGGVDLKEIDPERMESKKLKGLYFAGEVLNIDGETGGFNFQAAWSTAYVAAKSLALP